MFTTIVAGVDGSRPAEEAAHAAIRLAARAAATLYLVSVVEELPRYVSSHAEARRENEAARQYFGVHQERLCQAALHVGVECHRCLREGHEARELLAAASEHQADLLVIGHAGHSAVWESALGSTASQVVRHATCSVFIERPATSTGHVTRLTLALDGSPASWEAFVAALDLTQGTGGVLHIVSVIEGRPPVHEITLSAPPELSPTQRRWQTFLVRTQARAIARATTAHVAVEVSQYTGSASAQVVAACHEQHSGMLVVGATGHERPWHLTIGGTALKLAEEAPCAVLLVRPPRRGTLVGDVMRRPRFVAASTTPLEQVVLALLNDDARLVPVVNEQQKLVGILTLTGLTHRVDVLLLEHLAQLPTLAEARTYLTQLFRGRTAEGVMLKSPYVLHPDLSLSVAGRYLVAHHVTRAPVIDTAGQLLGIVSEHDIASALVTPLAHEGAPDERSDPNEGNRLRRVHSAIEGLSAEQLAQREMTLVSASAALDEVVDALHLASRGVVVVVDDAQRLCGLINDHSLLEQAVPLETSGWRATLTRLFAQPGVDQMHAGRGARGVRIAQPVLARDLMRADVAEIPKDALVMDALALLLAATESDVGVVVDKERQPLGLLWRRSTLRAIVLG